jgi:hypothetical protein
MPTTTIDDLSPELLELLAGHMDAASKKAFRRTCTRHRDAVDRAVCGAAVPECRLSVSLRAGALSRLVLPFRRWHGLRALSLQRLGRVNTDWLAGLRQLRHLNLCSCGGLSPDMCAALAKAPFWPALQTLDVSDNGIGLAGLWELGSAPAPALERFALRTTPDDPQVTLAPRGLEFVLPLLVENWPALRHANLRGQWTLGGKGVRAFASAFPGLRALDVSACVEPERLGATLHSLSRLLPELEQLRVENPIRGADAERRASPCAPLRPDWWQLRPDWWPSCPSRAQSERGPRSPMRSAPHSRGCACSACAATASARQGSWPWRACSCPDSSTSTSAARSGGPTCEESPAARAGSGAFRRRR